MKDIDLQRARLDEALMRGEFAPYVDELRQRASRGDNAALIALGHMHFKGGDGVERNYGEALFWFKDVKHEYDATGFAAIHLS